MKDIANCTAKPPSPPPIGGGLGGPQVLLAVIVEAINSTATAKFAQGGWGRHFLLPKKRIVLNHADIHNRPKAEVFDLHS
jgi:hypothetical protein